MLVLFAFAFLKVIRELLDDFDIDTDIWETTLNERLWHVCILLYCSLFDAHVLKCSNTYFQYFVSL